MRNIVFVILMIFLVGLLGGCGAFEPASKLNPPAWVQGEWADEFGTNRYTFTSNNIVLTGDGFIMDFREIYKNVSVNETSTGDLYKINIAEVEYRFEKLTDTTLNYWVTTTVTVGPVILIKQ